MEVRSGPLERKFGILIWKKGVLCDTSVSRRGKEKGRKGKARGSGRGKEMGGGCMEVQYMFAYHILILLIE